MLTKPQIVFFYVHSIDKKTSRVGVKYVVDFGTITQ